MSGSQRRLRLRCGGARPRQSPGVHGRLCIDDLSSAQAKEGRAAASASTPVEEASVNSETLRCLVDGKVNVGGHWSSQVLLVVSTDCCKYPPHPSLQSPAFIRMMTPATCHRRRGGKRPEVRSLAMILASALEVVFDGFPSFSR